MEMSGSPSVSRAVFMKPTNAFICQICAPILQDAIPAHSSSVLAILTWMTGIIFMKIRTQWKPELPN